MNENRSFVYYPPVCAINGKSKNRPGSIKAVEHRSKCIPIYDIKLMNGMLNIHKIIDECIAFREAAVLDNPRYFWVPKITHEMILEPFSKTNRQEKI